MGAETFQAEIYSLIIRVSNMAKEIGRGQPFFGPTAVRIFWVKLSAMHVDGWLLHCNPTHCEI